MFDEFNDFVREEHVKREKLVKCMRALGVVLATILSIVFVLASK